MNVFGNDLVITQALLSHLGEVFPDMLPRERLDQAGLAFLQGQMCVIDYLKSIYKQINEED